MNDEYKKRKPEWFDLPEGEGEANSGWLAIFSFLKPHLMEKKEQVPPVIEDHPILVRWKKRLANEPKNEALRIAMLEYIKDHRLKEEEWM